MDKSKGGLREFKCNFLGKKDNNHDVLLLRFEDQPQ